MKENPLISMRDVVREEKLANGDLRLYDKNGDYFDLNQKGQETYELIKDTLASLDQLKKAMK